MIAYSSLAQIGLIMLGLFATNSLGIDGAVLQMVNHGLISATLFLLAGAVERRTATGRFDSLGGMAKGRPALATVLMTTGVIALAVPGSGRVRGRVRDPRRGLPAGLALRGRSVRSRSCWRRCTSLRMISAVLHARKGPAVHDAALDLRPAELAILVPLVAILLFLSAWPAAITDRVVVAQATEHSPGRTAGARSSGSPMHLTPARSR